MIRKRVRERVGISFEGEESKTEQAHAQQCDINYILKEYQRTGIIRHAHENQGRYDDVSAVDYQHALNVVADTKSMFEALPSNVREEFGHDPARFLDFARNPENGLKMQEMGITPGIDGKTADGNTIIGMDELVAAVRGYEERHGIEPGKPESHPQGKEVKPG